MYLVYYAFAGGKQKTTKEFLLADKKMGTFPVAMSLMVSFMSGATLLGTSAEIYQFGTMYWLYCCGLVFAIFVTNYMYMPVYYRIDKMTSVYEVKCIKVCSNNFDVNYFILRRSIWNCDFIG